MLICNKKSLMIAVSALFITTTTNACSFVFWNGFEDSGGTVSSLCPTVTVAPTKINDTGVTQCGYAVRSWRRGEQPGDCALAVDNAETSLQVPKGQDGHYGTGKDGITGMAFEKVQGYEDKCVQDTHTGLMWEVKQGGDGTIGNEGLHDVDDTYTWYSEDDNSGDSGVISLSIDEYNQDPNICHGFVSGTPRTYCNTQYYVDRVNADGWCGHHDWRLPTRRELLSIVDYSQMYPAIDREYFPNTPSNKSFWTSNSYVKYDATRDEINGENAFRVYSSRGGSTQALKRQAFLIRLVRNGQ